VDTNTTATAAYGSDDATCPSGKKILGGGAIITTQAGAISSNRQITNSYPADDHSWSVSFAYTGGSAINIGYKVTVYAICGNVST
jgi:hypothetical protein